MRICNPHLKATLLSIISKAWSLLLIRTRNFIILSSTDPVQDQNPLPSYNKKGKLITIYIPFWLAAFERKKVFVSTLHFCQEHSQRLDRGYEIGPVVEYGFGSGSIWKRIPYRTQL
jgi:hypothetical protein